MSTLEPADESVMAPDETTANGAAAGGDPITAAHDNGGGLEWTVTDEANPFHRRFVVTACEATVLDLLLDPLVVQDILAALRQVNADQRRVLGLPSEPVTSTVLSSDDSTLGEAANGTAAESSSDDIDEGPLVAEGVQSSAVEAAGDTPPSLGPAGGPLTLVWWWQHKLLAFLLLFAAVFAGVGALTGSG